MRLSPDTRGPATGKPRQNNLALGRGNWSGTHCVQALGRKGLDSHPCRLTLTGVDGSNVLGLHQGGEQVQALLKERVSLCQTSSLPLLSHFLPTEVLCSLIKSSMALSAG